MTERPARPNLWGNPWVRLTAAALAFWLLAPQPQPLAVTQAFRHPSAAALAQAAAQLPYDGYIVEQAGLAELAAGQYAQAARHLEAAGNLLGWTAERRRALGDARQGLGQPAEALQEWQAAADLAPDEAAIWARLAVNYEAASQWDLARAAWQHLVDLRVTDPQAYYRLALVTAALEPAAAPARLALAAALAPPNALNADVLQKAIHSGQSADDPAYLYASVGYALIQIKEYPLAQAALTRAVAANPGYPDAHTYLGLAREMQGQDGAPEYEEAIRLAPDGPLAHFFLGLHWRRRGASDQALPHLQTAQNLDPANPAIAAEIGGAYAALGDLAKAEIAFTQAVQLAPREAGFWLLLARFYLDNNYHVADPGLPAARQAAGLAQDDAQAQDALGYALLLTGDLVNAQKSLERAAALDPQWAGSYYHLGLLYRAQNQPAQARAALEHALALDPQGPYGGAALKALAQLGAP